jgi:acyl-CoA reductase-like NAD-dependent aldehyde dehydrogenase
VAAVVAAAGCGGGGGGTLSKSEFIERGDAVCAKYRKKNQDLSKKAPARNPTDPQASNADVRETGPILSELADNVRSARHEFSQLRAPKDAASDWKNTLDDLDRVASTLDDAAAAAKKLDRQRISDDYTEILRLNRRVSGFETDYGFKVCGHNA